MSKYIIERDDFDEYKNGICFLKQNCTPNKLIIKAHIHNSIEILYITKGNFTVYANDKKYKLFAGDCILFRSNTTHYIIAGDEPGGYYYFLKIKPSALKNLTTPEREEEYTICFTLDNPTAKSLWTKSEIHNDNQSIKKGFNILINNLHRNQLFSDISCKIAVELILFDIFKSNQTTIDTNFPQNIPKDTINSICKAMLYINKNYTEDITCEQMCKMVNMSYSYFSRTFKAITGNSFKEYLNISRINYAESLLVNTKKTAIEICTECGFNSPAYFSKVYKEIKGVSPLTTRKIKFRP